MTGLGVRPLLVLAMENVEDVLCGAGLRRGDAQRRLVLRSIETAYQWCADVLPERRGSGTAVVAHRRSRRADRGEAAAILTHGANLSMSD